MTDSITRSVMDSLGSNGVDTLARLAGSDRSSAARTLGVGLPATIAGMLPHVSSDSGATGRLFDLVREEGSSIGRLDDLAAPLATPTGARSLFDRGGSILDAIFGARHAAVTDAVAHQSGVGGGVASSILRFGACALVSTLGSLIASHHLDARGFGQLLLGERANVAAALPASLFGVATGGMRDDRVVYAKRDRAVVAPVHTASSRRGWLAPAALLGLVAIGGYALLRGRHHESAPPATARYEPEPPTATPPPGLPVTRAPAPAAPVARGGGPEDLATPVAPIERSDRAMPSNAPVGNVGAATEGNVGAVPEGNIGAVPEGNIGAVPEGNVGAAPIGNIGAVPEGNVGAVPEGNVGTAPVGAARTVPAGQAEDRTVPAAPVEQGVRAEDRAQPSNAPVGAEPAGRGGGPEAAAEGTNFGPLNFAFNTRELTPASREHFDQLVSTLQARPNAHVQLIGHTDNVGDAAYNQRLSEDRAETIKSMLVSRGIDASRIDATSGRSLDQPIQSNDSSEGRAANRRTDVIISP